MVHFHYYYSFIIQSLQMSQYIDEAKKFTTDPEALIRLALCFQLKDKDAEILKILTEKDSELRVFKIQSEKDFELRVFKILSEKDSELRVFKIQSEKDSELRVFKIQSEKDSELKDFVVAQKQKDNFYKKSMSNLTQR